jgi:hypothetical protein
MKTLVGGEDKDPRKKGYGIPDKDSRKKETYKIKTSRAQKDPHAKEKSDPDYDKFRADYLKHAPSGRYNGYQAPDGSWHGHPASESAIKAHYKWSKMSADERKAHTERRKKEQYNLKKAPDRDSHRPVKPKESPKESPKTTPSERPSFNKRTEDHESMLKKHMAKKSASVKIVANKVKTAADKEKEKANKLKKTASRSKTPVRTKKGKK